ncbi:hypothetical protein [Arthrobacter sp. M2012083]|uniref:hypothetical protein n=1 Tax=Arthrobacter sp. M2012083 TaxID=1197706 RepID=UPI000379167A|nr:hypothetical protein [Arthrobacter sp. M2012083]
MTADDWARIITAIAGVFGLLVSVVAAVRTATNRETVAQRRASESLALLKSWEETQLNDENQRDVRAREALRQELLDRALHFTQIYVASTRPVYTSYWQPIGFGVFGLLWVWGVAQSPLGPSASSSWLVLVYLMLGVFVGGFAVFMYVRVSRHKEEVRARRKAGSRAATKPRERSKPKNRPASFEPASDVGPNQEPAQTPVAKQMEGR